ncbi:MAG: GNAT family N-acetyltransferase [Butyrivibrio sp.]|nr:GNAT family N-acetyltransferase [Butyrivibrio sp.]
MHFEYETSRMKLSVLNESYADCALRFYLGGRQAFEPVEPAKNAGFYTVEFQRANLQSELNAFINGTYMRYFWFAKEKPAQIIGTASFSGIIRGAYRSCQLGYKLLPEFQKQGYALEAVSRLITAVFEEERLHRIEAFTLPDNISSISLLTRLGFEFEGVARSVIMLRDGYADHNRYVMINPKD